MEKDEYNKKKKKKRTNVMSIALGSEKVIHNVS
jgi:hypothetical protein